VNWRLLDLNLLVVFDAVAQDRSVTRAAMRLGMTQPAMSHALARLRQALGDELFVRTPAGMDATPRAQQLIDPVRIALQSLRGALDNAGEFIPAETERSFKIAVNNHAALVVAAPLATAAIAEAPRIRLDFRPSGTLDTPELLDRGELDLAIGNRAAPAERFADTRLFHDHFVALLRKTHAAKAHAGQISLDTLASLPHLAVSSTGENTVFVDSELEKHGLARNVVLRAPLLAAASSLLQSDIVAVVSERAAREFARNLPLQVLTLPFRSPDVVTCMLWHRRHGDVPAHRWLRGVINRVARAL
jgi:DNA-binding transcriptional LysR family regulator